MFVREFDFTNMQIAGSVLSVLALIILLLPVKESEIESDAKINETHEELDENNYVIDNKKDDEFLTDL